MAFHEPYYSSQGTYQLGTYFQQNLESLFYQHGVDIVITGHVHAYERSFPVYNGTVRLCPSHGGPKCPIPTAAKHPTTDHLNSHTSVGPPSNRYALLGARDAAVVKIMLAQCARDTRCPVDINRALTSCRSRTHRSTSVARSILWSAMRAMRRVPTATRARTQCETFAKTWPPPSIR